MREIKSKIFAFVYRPSPMGRQGAVVLLFSLALALQGCVPPTAADGSGTSTLTGTNTDTGTSISTGTKVGTNPSTSIPPAPVGIKKSSAAHSASGGTTISSANNASASEYQNGAAPACKAGVPTISSVTNSCSGNGLTGCVSKTNIQQAGLNSTEESLEVYCVNKTTRVCLTGEKCPWRLHGTVGSYPAGIQIVSTPPAEMTCSPYGLTPTDGNAPMAAILDARGIATATISCDPNGNAVAQIGTAAAVKWSVSKPNWQNGDGNYFSKGMAPRPIPSYPSNVAVTKSCEGQGLIGYVTDDDINDGGWSAMGDSLEVYCASNLTRVCLTGEQCPWRVNGMTEDYPNGLQLVDTPVPSMTCAPYGMSLAYGSAQSGVIASCSSGMCSFSQIICDAKGNMSIQAAELPTATSTQRFSDVKILPIPATINGSAEAAGSLSILYSAAGGDQVTCQFTAAAQGADYKFSGCAPATFVNPNISYSAGDVIIADTVTVTAPACSSSTCVPFQAAQLYPSATEACAARISSTVHFLGNMSCQGAVTGLILNSANASVSVDGRDHSIAAPDASIGLYLIGSNINVQKINVSNVTAGSGLMAYNTENLVVNGSVFSGNQTGLSLYVDAISPRSVTISNNTLSGNASIALRITGDNGQRVNNPVIFRNDLSNSGYYAAWLAVDNATIDGGSLNNFNRSQNGIFLTGNSFNIQNLNLSDSGILKTQVMISNATSAHVVNCNLTYSAPALSTQERVALHLYKVQQSIVDQLTVINSDVGLKVATDGGSAVSLSLTNSTIQNSVAAGVILQSYDSTSMGTIAIQGNNLTLNRDGYAIWQMAPVASSSQLGPNQK